MKINDQKPNGSKAGMTALLFAVFFRIGLFTFGGGYAMISIIESICVEKKKWITHDDLMNITVIAESTPGPVAINCATFVGYKLAGIWGAAAAPLGVVLPSFIIIYLISLFLNDLLEIKAVASAFRGIKPAVAVLILQAAVNMIKKAEKKPLLIMITAASFVAMLLINVFSLNFSTICLMLIAAVIGLIAYALTGKGKEAAE